MKPTSLLFPALCFLLIPFYSFTQAEQGSAVYYADDLDGQGTSYGDVYRMNAFTAAHKSYPPGTIVQVLRPDNGQAVNVRINDKIKAGSDNLIILSKAAAQQIGLVRAGRANVRVTRVGYINPSAATAGQENQLTARSPYSEYNYNQYSANRQAPSAYDFIPQGPVIPNATPAPPPPNANQYLLPATSFGYAIQLASFKDMANARKQVMQLLDKGVPHVYIWQADNRKRVVVASFPDKESAERYYRSLRGEFGLEGIIVKIGK